MQVKDGEVTLSGTVDDRQQKRHAEDVADAVSGVKHVQNNLRVTKSQNGAKSGWSASAAGTSDAAQWRSGQVGTSSTGTSSTQDSTSSNGTSSSENSMGSQIGKDSDNG